MSCTYNNGPSHLHEAVSDLEGVTRLREFRLQLSELGSVMSAGQRRLHKTQRAATLGLSEPPGQNFERDFAVARRQAVRARQSLRLALQSDSWNEIRRAVNPAGAAFGEALAEARGIWVDGLLEADTNAVIAGEVVGVFDRVSDELRGGGVDALGGFLEEQLAELDSVLTADRNWGREQHSPLEWWEWVLLAALIGAFVLAVLACFWWSDCSWVRAAVAAACDVIAVIDGLQWLEPTCRALLRAIS
jgi:hypothetical protein